MHLIVMHFKICYDIGFTPSHHNLNKNQKNIFNIFSKHVFYVSWEDTFCLAIQMACCFLNLEIICHKYSQFSSKEAILRTKPFLLSSIQKLFIRCLIYATQCPRPLGWSSVQKRQKYLLFGVHFPAGQLPLHKGWHECSRMVYGNAESRVIQSICFIKCFQLDFLSSSSICQYCLINFSLSPTKMLHQVNLTMHQKQM